MISDVSEESFMSENFGRLELGSFAVCIRIGRHNETAYVRK